jgi:hypothetical protein
MTGSMHTMDDKNCCLHTAQHLFLVLCAKAVVCSKDVDGEQLSDEDYNTIKHIDAQDQSIVAMDYSVITCQKGKEKQQLQAFCQKVGMCNVEYDNFVGLLLEVIGKVVSTKRVAQKLEPKVPAIAFGVNPHKFAERHEKKYKKGDCRWASFENTVTAGVHWATHPQSYWLSKNNSNLVWDRAVTVDGSITDFFQQTFGPSPIYELAASCNIFRGCIGAQTKE